MNRFNIFSHLVSLTAVITLSLPSMGATNSTGHQMERMRSNTSGLPSQSSIEHLLSTQPKSFTSHWLAARLYEENGLLDQAREEYSIAIRCKAPQVGAYKRLAQINLKMNDYNKAESTALLGVNKFPNDFGMALTAGYIFHNEGKFERALKFYEQACQIQPQKSDAYLAASDVCLSMHNPARSLNYLSKALSLSNSQLAHYERARALVELGREPEAVEDFYVAFKLDRFNATVDKAFADILIRNKIYGKAMEVLLSCSAKAEGKDLVSCKEAIGNLILKMPDEQFVSVLQESEKNVVDKNLRARMHFSLGDIYDRLKLPAKAVEQYKLGLSLNPKYERGYLRLAEDLEDHYSNNSAALSCYQKAKSLEAKDPELKDPELNLRLSTLEKKLASVPSKK